MIHGEDYKQATNGLGVGEVIKIPHLGCSESNCMRVQNKVEGLHFYCFKCTEQGFTSSYNSPLERLKRKRELEAYQRIKAQVDYSLPADFSHSIASAGLAWLGKGGWTLAMMKKYSIGWSETLNRVILPVYFKGEYKGFTARAVRPDQFPKYLEKVPSGVMWESKRHKPSAKANTVCVVCEDILSAGRCGEFMKAYSILGTTLSTSLVSTLMYYPKVILWLDDDAGGHLGIAKALPKLRLVIDCVQIVHSKRDPKLLTDQEIKRRLYD